MSLAMFPQVPRFAEGRVFLRLWCDFTWWYCLLSSLKECYITNIGIVGFVHLAVKLDDILRPFSCPPKFAVCPKQQLPGLLPGLWKRGQPAHGTWARRVAVCSGWGRLRKPTASDSKSWKDWSTCSGEKLTIFSEECLKIKMKNNMESQ